MIAGDANSGSAVFPGGVIYNWGTYNFVSGYGGCSTVTFNKPFTSFYTPMTTDNAQGNKRHSYVTKVDLNSMTVCAYDGSVTSGYVYWAAVGK